MEKHKLDELKQFKVLAWAFSFLREHDREDGVAEILLQHHLQVDRATFFAQMQELVPMAVWTIFKADIEAHCRTGIPVQHMIGYEYFYGRKFQVNEHVLVPRMETEELVLQVIDRVKQQGTEKPLSIVDVGTGSGVIAVSLALELPNVTMYATDISKQALQVAQSNAHTLQADITFYEGNFLQPIIDKGIHPQIIVSNPPYISWRDEPSLSDTVKDFDPALALFAEEDGLAAYKKILEQISKYLQQTKLICFEIGYNQKESITKITQHIFPQATIQCIQDINQKDRIITISL